MSSKMRRYRSPAAAIAKRLRDDVAADALGGGRGERVQADVRPAFAELGQLPVLGPEIVAPMADAVRLVDGKRLDLQLTKLALKELCHEPFRRHEEQAHAALGELSFAGILLRQRLRAIEADSVHSAGAQAVDLILHQGNERGYDHGGVAAENGGRLVAE